MPDEPNPPLRTEIEDGVAVVTLSRAQRRNALSVATLEALGATLARLEADADVRCIVIDAEGPAFCAGHDLGELEAHRGDADAGRAFFEATFSACSAVMSAVTRQRQPVIAAVEGVATAAGCQLVASCDLAVAGAAARFCTPGVNIGLFCSTPAVALARSVQPKAAMEMLLLGEMLDAQAALRIGLVNRVIGEGEALAVATAMARRIADKPSAVVAGGKATFHRQRVLPLDEAYGLAGDAMTEGLLSADAREGISAFLEKRRPQWG
jgi:enoyl-CoA hydratase/carnithine racemase